MPGHTLPVLGIDVPDELVARWRGWLMPAVQPYLVPRDLARSEGWVDEPERLSFEVKDSFWLYALGDDALVWLTRSQGRRLPEPVRHAQPAPHRWPSPDPARDRARTIRFVEDGRRPSRHADVAPETWERAVRLLPGARALAGSFPEGSGPNCFGAVMGAAGVPGAATTWMQREPFEAWLADSTARGGDDDVPGTVLLWRDTSGAVQHAAVTLGDGWALHKPSQGWMSPTKVLAVRDTIASARQRRRHLERHRIRH